MKPAVEWLNEVGETVATAMFCGQKPPGIEVERLIKSIQDDAQKDIRTAAQQLLIRIKESNARHGFPTDVPWPEIGNLERLLN